MAFKDEAERALIRKKEGKHYSEELEESQRFRREYKKRNFLIKAEDMPWENSPQGLIKHIINEKMDTMECCVDVYQQFLSPGGHSGKHRHMAEEIFYVLEGKGYDLHWDVKFDVKDEYSWEWADESKRYDWEEGDYVYIPPFAIHQHFNASPDKPTRFITVTNRIVKAMGFNWIDQIENAPGYKS